MQVEEFHDYDIYMSHASAATNYAGYLKTLLANCYGLKVFFYADFGIAPTVDQVRECIQSCKQCVVCFNTEFAVRGYFATNEVTAMSEEDTIVLIGDEFSSLQLQDEVNGVEIRPENARDRRYKIRLDQNLRFLQGCKWFLVENTNENTQDLLRMLKVDRPLKLPTNNFSKTVHFIFEDFVSSQAAWMSLELQTEFGFICTKSSDGFDPNADIFVIVLTEAILSGTTALQPILVTIDQNFERYKNRVVAIRGFRRSMDQNAVGVQNSRIIKHLFVKTYLRPLEHEREQRLLNYSKLFRDVNLSLVQIDVLRGQIYKSNTCEVWQVENFAFKFFQQQQHYENEIRFRKSVFTDPESGDFLVAAGSLENFVFNRPFMDKLDARRLSSRVGFHMELCSRTLLDVILKEAIVGKSESIDEIRRISQKAATCLAFVNGKRFAHMDFKPRNFIRARSGAWKLIDFDAAKLHDSFLTTCKIGAHGKISSYASPEAARHFLLSDIDCKVGVFHDVWSFGVVLFELLTGMALFAADRTDDRIISKNDMQELCNWIGLSRRQESLVLMGADPPLRGCAVDLLSKCLHHDASQRPDFQTILKHPFFNDDLRATMTFSFEENTHLFLSHNQREASGITKDLYYSLMNHGIRCWLDVTIGELNWRVMQRGVKTAKAFVVILTRNIYMRPLCIAEFIWAVHFRKQCVAIIEEDLRFTSKWDEVVFRDPKHGVNDDIVSILNSLNADGAFHGIFLKDHDFTSYLQTDFKALVDKHLPHSQRIPYRRRYYDSKGMIEELIRQANLYSLTKPLMAVPSQRIKLVVVGDRSFAWTSILERLEGRNLIMEQTNDVDDENTIVFFPVIKSLQERSPTNEFRNRFIALWKHEKLNKNNVIAVEHEYFVNNCGEEEPDESIKQFLQTIDFITYRSTPYELDALVSEILRRILKLPIH